MDPRSELRTTYFSSVCSAIARYQSTGGSVRLSSERQGDQLLICFTLDDPERFQRTHRSHLRAGGFDSPDPTDVAA